ncbi:MAG: glycosyl hydrolase 108 family protein, partial [Bellilinea sp.]
FDGVVQGVLSREGGYNASDGKSKAPVNMGINQAANPDVDVKNLTPAKAKEIYKERYWNAIDADKLSPAAQIVAFDAAVNQGVPFAKKIIAETGGDPTKMIALRRARYEQLSKDPEHAPSAAGWAGRMARVEADASSAAYGPETNGMPRKVDIMAKLPIALSGVEKKADELYGKSRNNPKWISFVDKTNQEIRAQITLEAQQADVQENQAVDKIGAFVDGRDASGVSNPAAAITSISQIQANPGMMRIWQSLTNEQKGAFEARIEKNLSSPRGAAGDYKLYQDLMDRVHLDQSDPNKIYHYSQIVKPEIFRRLSHSQAEQLRSEIARDETASGRGFNQSKAYYSKRIESYFKSHESFTLQPDRANAAIDKWNDDVGKKIDEYMKQPGKNPMDLFNGEADGSMVSGRVLQQYVNSTTAAKGLEEMAQKARQAMTPEQIAKLPQAPATIKTPEEARAWMQTLPAEATHFYDPVSKSIGLIPGRVAAVPAATAAPAEGVVGTPAVTPATAPIATPTDDIPKLIDSPERYMGEFSSPEQKAAASERIKTLLAKGFQSGVYVATLPLRGGLGVVKGARDVGEAAAKMDVEKPMNDFRILAGQKTFRANETTYRVLNDFVASGLGTEAEKAKAQKMLKLMADKFGVEKK